MTAAMDVTVVYLQKYRKRSELSSSHVILGLISPKTLCLVVGILTIYVHYNFIHISKEIESAEMSIN